ncbi:MAG: PEP-CTERM sorting domain-containing protein [Burkholderiales bacterium]|nr:PEP-CTERM sorting domain-containing protein [Burkholderiales bacterium]
MNFKKTFCAGAAALSLVAGGAQAATLSLVASANQVAIDDFVTVDVVITGLDAINEIVSGYDLNVGYNTALLEWSVITTYFGPLGGFDNVLWGLDSDDSDGDIGGDATSFLTDGELDVLQGDSWTLMSFMFKGKADGATFLNFGADPDFQRLVTGRLNQDDEAGVLNLTYQGTCIAVGTGDCNNRVPEPETYGLAAIALLGAGLARRRQVAKVVKQA